MSNKPESFVPYYKIKWSRKSCWSLEQAAYLLCGKDPDLKNYDISVHATNIVSKRYYWFLNKRNKGVLLPITNDNGIEYFNTGSTLRLLKDKKITPDKEMEKVMDHMWQAPYGIDHSDYISRSVYREAGRLVFQQFPYSTKADVAMVIKDLPKFFNSENHGHIKSLQPHQIEEYLEGLSLLSGKPKSAEKMIPSVDLSQIIEKM